MSQTVSDAETVVLLTEAAVEEVKSMHTNQPEDAGKPLRVYIEKGGCSGMQYGLVFDEVREGDLVQEFNGVQVVVDGVSADYIRGSTVDYSSDLSGGGFKLTNPKARTTCGCGKSFEA